MFFLGAFYINAEAVGVAEADLALPAFALTGGARDSSRRSGWFAGARLGRL